MKVHTNTIIPILFGEVKRDQAWSVVRFVRTCKAQVTFVLAVFLCFFVTHFSSPILLER